MAIPSKQIGWSQESNLLWEISKQMERLTGVAFNSGGGPGVTPGIDDVLAVGQKFTADRTIDADYNNFTITNNEVFNLENNLGEIYLHQSGRGITIGDFSVANIGSTINVNDNIGSIYTNFLNITEGILISNFNSLYQFGAINANNKSTLNIDDNIKRFFTSYYDGANTKVIGFDILPTQTNFGLIDSVTGVNFSMYMAFVNDPLGSGDEFITTSYKGNTRGLFLNFYSDTYYLGDFAQITGASFIAIDEVAQRITHYTNNFYLNDLGTGNLIQSTPSGPATGDYLKININGVNYVIELKTP